MSDGGKALKFRCFITKENSSEFPALTKLIEELNLAGLTLIVVTHDREMGERSNRLIELRDGKIINDQRKS